ncbi:low specificity L-threonine aldolase [Agrobacterium tumefaciens]|nr:low specificity L-threonine aldolase [Agrobacterium tumefaciens]
MFFASDNWAGAHPAVNERLSRESTRFAAAYGTSELDLSIEKRFNEIFEREVAVFLSPPARRPIRFRWPASPVPAA